VPLSSCLEHLLPRRTPARGADAGRTERCRRRLRANRALGAVASSAPASACMPPSVTAFRARRRTRLANAAVRHTQEGGELLGVLCDFAGRAARLSSGGAGGGGSETVGALAKVSGVRELLLTKHGERCEALVNAVREELQQLQQCCASMCTAVDTAYEGHYRVAARELARATEPPRCAPLSAMDDERDGGHGAAAVAVADLTSADFLQWMSTVQRAYAREVRRKEKLVDRIEDWSDDARVMALRQAWSVQPYVGALDTQDTRDTSSGRLSSGARVICAVQEDSEAAAAGGGVPTHATQRFSR
jgi:hypothetical protein